MTANSELEAAITAGIGALEALIRECVSYRDVQGFSAHEEVYQLINGYRIDPKRPDASKAFTAYREQVASLQAENARLRDTLSSIALNAPQIAPQHFNYNRNYVIADSFYTAGKLAAAALADVETKSTVGGEQ